MRTIWFFTFLIWLAGASWSSAQENPAGTNVQSDKMAQIEEQIQLLQTELKDLRDKQEAASAAAAVAPERLRNNEVAERLKFRVFGDVGYRATTRKGDTNTFEIGSLDLFMTSHLSDHVSALGEVLFISQSDNSIGVDVERLLMNYKVNDYLSVAIGRYHTSIGYYNTAFHQGAWFQTAVDRPFMYAFDDKGGFLPLQEVGITANGRMPSGKLGLNYVVESGNGRAHALGSDPAQNGRDMNNGKSFNLALFARPSWVSGLQAGFSFYRDHLTFVDSDNQVEQIMTAHVIYRTSDYEFLNEGLFVRHVNDAGGTVVHTPGFYTQFSKRFGSYRPYLRYSYVNPGPNDPIYSDPNDATSITRQNGPSVGLRYDFSEHSAFKLQYSRLGVRDQKSSNGINTQLAFTF